MNAIPNFNLIKKFFEDNAAIDTALGHDFAALILALHEDLELQLIDSKNFSHLLEQFYLLLQAISEGDTQKINGIQTELQEKYTYSPRSFNAYRTFMYSLGGVFIGLILGLIITAVLIASEGKTLSDLLTAAPMGIGALLGMCLDIKSAVLGLLIGTAVGALLAAGIFVGIEHETLSLPALILPFVLTGIASGAIGGFWASRFTQVEHKIRSDSVNEKSDKLEKSIATHLRINNTSLHSFWHLTKVSDSKVVARENLSPSQK